MTTDERYVTLVHPGAEDVPVSYSLAPRLASLQGARIGLIDNRKRHSDVFLTRLQELLRERYGVADFQYYTKDGASVATPPAVLADMARNCDAVIHAVAD
jgi:hypothetical protein